MRFSWKALALTACLGIVLLSAPAVAQHRSLPEQFSRDGGFGGIKLIVHPLKPPRGEARRSQIERVDIDGDYAEVGARGTPDNLHTALLVKTGGRWRVVEW